MDKHICSNILKVCTSTMFGFQNQAIITSTKYISTRCLFSDVGQIRQIFQQQKTKKLICWSIILAVWLAHTTFVGLALCWNLCLVTGNSYINSKYKIKYLCFLYVKEKNVCAASRLDIIACAVLQGQSGATISCMIYSLKW